MVETGEAHTALPHYGATEGKRTFSRSIYRSRGAQDIYGGKMYAGSEHLVSGAERWEPPAERGAPFGGLF